mmetsp:Transcript_92071/g.244608  ORF Transcript_92071/g.244608 Transcript_92071/m.244608 type:complete len:96 (+) Transcript_92071:131-418(+)
MGGVIGSEGGLCCGPREQHDLQGGESAIPGPHSPPAAEIQLPTPRGPEVPRVVAAGLAKGAKPVELGPPDTAAVAPNAAFAELCNEARLAVALVP